MTTIVVPPFEEEPWPTLGPQVCDFIEDYLVFGPGDLRGEPAKLDIEKRALIYRAYEVFPKGHPEAGRRRFRRVAFSLRKGSAKTELAAWIAAAELHPEGPVRCDGFDGSGQPVGRGVTDPYIPLVAYTEEQSEDLAYAALYSIISMSKVAEDFDIGLERIMRIRGDGKAVALASAPDARDGARTTFQHFDETHRFTQPRLKAAHGTMLANLPKRRIADPWSLETTTAPEPGGGSVAEDTFEYARSVQQGNIKDSRLFFFHRQAADSHDLETEEGLRAAIVEASGPVAEWSDIDGIAEQFRDPTVDRAYIERVWLNRPVQAATKAFDIERWHELTTEASISNRELITLGFGGPRYHDATALVATHVKTGFQWPIAIWEAPPGRDGAWEVPEADVEALVEECFRRWDVWRMYADPPYWEANIAAWAGKYGSKKVVSFKTNRLLAMATALRGFANAITAGDVTNDGDEAMARHLGDARRQLTNVRDERGERLWLIRKERPDSPHRINGALAGCLSWEARNDAIADGATKEFVSVYETRGFLSF